MITKNRTMMVRHMFMFTLRYTKGNEFILILLIYLCIMIMKTISDRYVFSMIKIINRMRNK